MADTTPPKVKGALFGGLLLVLGLATGAMVFGNVGGGASAAAHPITLTVPGAMQINVFCGGSVTERSAEATPETLTFVPAGPTCDVEAPLTPAIPLRGELAVGPGDAYLCVRSGLDLVCGVAPGGDKG